MYYQAILYPRAESNCHLKFRKLPFYPLNYKGPYLDCKTNRKKRLFQINLIN